MELQNKFKKSNKVVDKIMLDLRTPFSFINNLAVLRKTNNNVVKYLYKLKGTGRSCELFKDSAFAINIDKVRSDALMNLKKNDGAKIYSMDEIADATEGIVKSLITSMGNVLNHDINLDIIVKLDTGADEIVVQRGWVCIDETFTTLPVPGDYTYKRTLVLSEDVNDFSSFITLAAIEQIIYDVSDNKNLYYENPLLEDTSDDNGEDKLNTAVMLLSRDYKDVYSLITDVCGDYAFKSADNRVLLLDAIDKYITTDLTKFIEKYKDFVFDINIQNSLCIVTAVEEVKSFRFNEVYDNES